MTETNTSQDDNRPAPKKNLLIASLAGASIILLIVIYFVPIWWVSLTAPNYPEAAFPDGVRINFHMNGVFNGCTKIEKDEIEESEALDCVHEMDTINHYVGMYPIAAGGPIERGFSPFLITMLAIMILGFIIRDKKTRVTTLSVLFIANTLWMSHTIYFEKGLSTQNQGYLYALMNQLDQDANDTTQAESIELADSDQALAKLKASLAGNEEAITGVEEPGSEAQEEARIQDKAQSTSEKQRLINELRASFEVDMMNQNSQEVWQENGYQLMSWHYTKVLGRYFNNQDEIQPMVKKLKLAITIVFIALIIAQLLLIYGAMSGKGLFYQLMIFVPMALPIFFVVDYAAWLWWYGHTLNDMGAFSVKPFMPTVFGVGKVAQFSTYSYPSIGFILMLINSAILGAIVLIKRR